MGGHRPLSITVEHEALRVCFLLHHSVFKVQLGHDDVQHFPEDECDTYASPPTVCTYLKGDGLSQLIANV